MLIKKKKTIPKIWGEKSETHLGTEWVKDDITRENFQKYLK